MRNTLKRNGGEREWTMILWLPRVNNFYKTPRRSVEKRMCERNVSSLFLFLSSILFYEESNFGEFVDVSARIYANADFQRRGNVIREFFAILLRIRLSLVVPFLASLVIVVVVVVGKEIEVSRR